VTPDEYSDLFEAGFRKYLAELILKWEDKYGHFRDAINQVRGHLAFFVYNAEEAREHAGRSLQGNLGFSVSNYVDRVSLKTMHKIMLGVSSPVLVPAAIVGAPFYLFYEGVSVIRTATNKAISKAGFIKNAKVQQELDVNSLFDALSADTVANKMFSNSAKFMTQVFEDEKKKMSKTLFLSFFFQKKKIKIKIATTTTTTTNNDNNNRSGKGSHEQVGEQQRHPRETTGLSKCFFDAQRNRNAASSVFPPAFV
jgi:hypothetical protein